jgi:hypothetical protein
MSFEEYIKFSKVTKYNETKDENIMLSDNPLEL